MTACRTARNGTAKTPPALDSCRLAAIQLGPTAEVLDRFEKAGRELAQIALQAAGRACKLVVLPEAASCSLGDVQHAMPDFAEGITDANLRAVEDTLRLASPTVAAALQQCFVRGYFDALIEGSAILARAARRNADGRMRPFEAQVEQHHWPEQASAD